MKNSWCFPIFVSLPLLMMSCGEFNECINAESSKQAAIQSASSFLDEFSKGDGPQYIDTSSGRIFPKDLDYYDLVDIDIDENTERNFSEDTIFIVSVVSKREFQLIILVGKNCGTDIYF